MAATLGEAGIQPTREGCFDPVMLNVLELRIEEKFSTPTERDQNAPNGHSVNIGARVMALSPTLAAKPNGSGLVREGGVSVK
ncbi:hypothetical protein N8H74_18985 [Pseudomonas sp. B2M1-30]|uniref:Uncharacterized protein n=1 Tax=Pseudomonas koreensis TaxID=198620 RepID=A0A9X2XHK8_9PSED|nr:MULTISPECIES: hypothetical protein [Pseudomonas]MBV4473707.1 hypothetical protein [Pseudomonas botevensis]MCU0120354.1 hypothetical protein [Pseudomonas sp. B2M1-30]MCU7249075.1 hypothetical protein [Pseudomonas koreensis]MCU7260816.1 hypothetical protein [Pseudomonas koreensis]